MNGLLGAGGEKRKDESDVSPGALAIRQYAAGTAIS